MKLYTIATVILTVVVSSLSGAQVGLITTCNPLLYTHRGTLIRVDKLTDVEINRRKLAADKLAKAQAEFAATENAIRVAHGDAQCPNGASVFEACMFGTDVVFDGDFALSYYWTANSGAVFGSAPLMDGH